jgi:hypothetical protein
VLAAAGDLARHAEKVWTDLVVGTDAFTRVAVASQVERLKAELAGPDPSPLEKLVVDHTAIAYLAQRQAEISAAQTGGTIPLFVRRRARHHSRVDAQEGQVTPRKAVRAVGASRQTPPFRFLRPPSRVVQSPRFPPGAAMRTRLLPLAALLAVAATLTAA